MMLPGFVLNLFVADSPLTAAACTSSGRRRVEINMTIHQVCLSYAQRMDLVEDRQRAADMNPQITMGQG